MSRQKTVNCIGPCNSVHVYDNDDTSEINKSINFPVQQNNYQEYFKLKTRVEFLKQPQE
jgi:hypothetical protein